MELNRYGVDPLQEDVPYNLYTQDEEDDMLDCDNESEAEDDLLESNTQDLGGRGYDTLSQA